MHLCRSISSSKKKKKRKKRNKFFCNVICMYFKIYRSNFPNFPRLIGILCFSFFENLHRYPINLKIVCKLYVYIYARQIEGEKKKKKN